MAIPLLAPLLSSLVSWIFREVVVKFLIFTGLYLLIAFLVPYAIGFLLPFIGTGDLTSAFNVVSPGVWFFLDFFRLDFGVPLLISAFVARFLIRRLPVIG
ncbi:MAG: DUF2523 domain-containing protein [Zoogloeaceae bacterium]|jgi:hypothetical protein|nr:DUF2523 domain-containing protein [Zoogloeaceae bacterium]